MASQMKTEVLNELWRRGHLSWKLHEGQKDLYNLFTNSKNKVNVWLCGRRLGKSYSLSILAIEQCLKYPNSIVKIVAPTKIQVEQNIRPLIKKIIEDCPKDIKPNYNAKDYIYYFPNGSEIQLAGTDGGHAERLRGADCHLAIVDEAGTCKELKNVVNNILLPTTLLTKGKVILASTPPAEADHEFLEFIDNAEKNSTLVKKPSQSNPMLTEEDFIQLAESLGGVQSDSYQREVLCIIIKDPTLSVIPEFTPDLEKIIVTEHIKPAFLDCYVSMDLGFRDMTALLFAYFDFKNDKVVIEDELILNFQDSDVNLPVLVQKVKQKEMQHFLDIKTAEQRKPHLRVSDLNPIVTQEIGRLSHYDVTFTNANKQDKEATINKIRMMLSNHKIVINPRCVTLIRQLRNTRWASNSSNVKKIFSRSGGEHGDALDALIYLIGSINYTKNPYPAFYNMDTRDMFIKNPKALNQNNNNYIETYKKIFNIKPKE